MPTPFLDSTWANTGQTQASRRPASSTETQESSRPRRFRTFHIQRSRTPRGNLRSCFHIPNLSRTTRTHAFTSSRSRYSHDHGYFRFNDKASWMLTCYQRGSLLPNTAPQWDVYADMTNDCVYLGLHTIRSLMDSQYLNISIHFAQDSCSQLVSLWPNQPSRWVVRVLLISYMVQFISVYFSLSQYISFSCVAPLGILNFGYFWRILDSIGYYIKWSRFVDSSTATALAHLRNNLDKVLDSTSNTGQNQMWPAGDPCRQPSSNIVCNDIHTNPRTEIYMQTCYFMFILELPHGGLSISLNISMPVLSQDSMESGRVYADYSKGSSYIVSNMSNFTRVMVSRRDRGSARPEDCTPSVIGEWKPHDIDCWDYSAFG